MGAMSDLYASRMRGPEPDDDYEWVQRMAQAMRLGHERHARRAERVLEALRHGAAHETTDDGELYV